MSRAPFAAGHIKDGKTTIRMARHVGATNRKLQCAWCRKTMRDGDEPASHGICQVCEAKHFGGRITRFRALQAWADYGLACEARGQASGPEQMVRASRRVTTAHLRAHETMDRLIDQEAWPSRRRIHVDRDEMAALVTAYGRACRRGGDAEAAYDAFLDALYGPDAKMGAPEANRDAPGSPGVDDDSKVAGSPPSGNSGGSGLDPAKPYVVTIADRMGELGKRYASTFDGMLEWYRALREAWPEEGIAFSFGNWDRADLDDDGLTDAERELLEEVLHD